MTPHFLEELVFATLNVNKVKEIKHLCDGYKVNVLGASKYTNTLPPETGTTFSENAEIKAKYIGKLINKPSLADDSGFCISELDDYPGVYSARIAGEDQNYSLAINKIYEKLKEKSININECKARFVSVLALYLPREDKTEFFEGIIEGIIAKSPKGKFEFGYDPIFIPNGYTQTFSEMPMELKNSISHRGIAFKIFAQKWLCKN